MPDKQADRTPGVRRFKLQFPCEGEVVLIYFSAFFGSYKEAVQWKEKLIEKLEPIHATISPHEPRTLKIRVCADKEPLPSKATVTHIENPTELKAREVFTMPCYRKAL